MIRSHRYLEKAFALPTILIASVVMIIVMLAAIQSVVSIRIALDNQYYDKLAQEAAESGATMAASCIKAGNVSWTVLKPNTDCTGSGGTPYLLSTPNIRTSFSVTKTGDTGEYVISVSTSVELLRTSNSLPWKTFTQSTTRTIKPLGWKQLSAGYNHTCGLLTDNNMYCWGNNTSGQLGNGTTTAAGSVGSNKPTKVTIPAGLVGKTITSIKAGGLAEAEVSCAVTSDGQLWCWGDNTNKQIANTTAANYPIPTLINTGSLSGKLVTAVSIGWEYICAVASDQLYCWGINTYSQLGEGTTGARTTPYPVTMTTMNTAGTPKALDVSASAHSTCATATTAGGTTATKIFCWGRHNISTAQYRLGNGGTAATYTIPANPTAGSTVTGTPISLSEGPTGGCVIAGTTVTTYCWGYAGRGAGGDNTTTDRNIPTAVTQQAGMLSGKVPSSVSRAYYHSCAVASNVAYCWGAQDNGKLGNNVTSGDSLVAVPVSTTGVMGTQKIASITAGTLHTCALTVTGTAYCWGQNLYGQLGSGGGTGDFATPVKVDVSAIPSTYVIY